jgi:predicted nucleotidyltransferase component of viral defense system
MLQYSTLESGTLELLKKLMQVPELKDFYLAGGTALALYYGHRRSIDLDLFCMTDFCVESILPLLQKKFPSIQYGDTSNPLGLFCFIDDIKVDFVRYGQFKVIENPLEEDGVRLFGLHDLMAMKVAAILRRAVKKDFWDIAEILTHFSMEELIAAYNKKYPNQQLAITIPQALTYFADAEESEKPVSLKNQTWKSVKKIIQQNVKAYLS